MLFTYEPCRPLWSWLLLQVQWNVAWTVRVCHRCKHQGFSAAFVDVWRHLRTWRVFLTHWHCETRTWSADWFFDMKHVCREKNDFEAIGSGGGSHKSPTLEERKDQRVICEAKNWACLGRVLMIWYAIVQQEILHLTNDERADFPKMQCPRAVEKDSIRFEVRRSRQPIWSPLRDALNLAESRKR